MKIHLLAALVLLTFGRLFAQDETPSANRLFAGGNFGLSLGRYTLINVSPQVGYRFSNRVAAGMGLNLQYASHKERIADKDYSKTSQGITGLNLFGRFYPVQNIFLQVQPEANYIFGKTTYYLSNDYQPLPAPQTFKNDSEIVPCFFVGGGYATAAGRGTFLVTVLYDVIQQPNSPYGNRPIVSFGYNIGL